MGSWDRDWVARRQVGWLALPTALVAVHARLPHGLLEQQGLRVERTEYLLSPFIWAHTLQNVVRDRPAWRWASGLLSERSVPALMAYGALDTVQRWTRGRTSNMRVVARKS